MSQFVDLQDPHEVVRLTAHFLNDSPLLPREDRLVVIGAWHSFDNLERAQYMQHFLLLVIEEWLRCGRHVMPKGAQVIGRKPNFRSEAEWDLVLYSSGRIEHAWTSWLWRVYWDWNNRNPPSRRFTHDGLNYFTYTINPTSILSPDNAYQLTCASPPEEFPPFLNADSSHLLEWDESLLWFVLFLNSGKAHLLDRCAICNSFIARERLARTIKGTVIRAKCSKCRIAGSTARKKRARKSVKNVKLDLISQFWPRVPKKIQKHEQKLIWVADAVSEVLERRNLDPIKRNTVSHWLNTNNKGSE